MPNNEFKPGDIVTHRWTWTRSLREGQIGLVLDCSPGPHMPETRSSAKVRWFKDGACITYYTAILKKIV